MIRWNHPKRGPTEPDVFIPIAEKSGMIDALGNWVLEECCRQIQRWRAMAITLPVLSINVSATQLKGPIPLDAQFRETLSRFDVDPSLIEIELTESAVIETAELYNDVMRRLHEVGVGVAIDEFGTGYTSLEHLQRYKVDKLKVSQRFVSKVGSDPSAKAIVRATLVLARELGMETVADGVETAEQLAFVMSVGCNRVQGFYYCRPVPEAEASELLRVGFIRRAPGLEDNQPSKVGRASA